MKLTGLLHDSPEAFLTDLAKPVKEHKEMKVFKEAEDKLMYYIAIKFGLSYPFDEQIKVADKILLNTEYRDLMTKNKLRENDFNGSKPLEEKIVPWTPQKAKFGMIDRLERLGIKVEQ
jgi:5'-deoxynucleotidase YfbR-like HD superfamily hydrolase